VLAGLRVRLSGAVPDVCLNGPDVTGSYSSEEAVAACLREPIFALSNDGEVDLQSIGWAVSGAVGLGGLWVANSAGNRQRSRRGV
jgi:hypothetical protein